MQVAVLIHLLNWNYKEEEISIDKKIAFVHLKTHPVGKLYEKICKTDKVDYGEPYNYDTAIVFYDDIEKDHLFFPLVSKYSLPISLINLLVVIYKGTLGQCRVIVSNDNFKTSLNTHLLYEGPTEFINDLVVFHSKFNKEKINLLKSIWGIVKTTHNKSVQNSRIENVLSFFYHSWNTLTLEQTGIYLSIVLEALFSPHSNNELAHQISYNVAKFMGTTKQQKNDIYKLIKKYYSIRSKLVHGETINQNELESIPLFFKSICDLIIKIISNQNLINIFNDNKLRKEFIENQLFE